MGGVPSVFEGGFLPKHFVRGGPIGKFQVIDSNQHPSYKYPGYFSSFSDAQRQRLLADLIGKPRVYDGDGQLDSTRSGAGINIAELQAEELVKLTLQLHSRVKVQWFFRNWVQVQWGRLKLFAEELGDMVSLLEARNPQQFKQGFCRCAGHGDLSHGCGWALLTLVCWSAAAIAVSSARGEHCSTRSSAPALDQQSSFASPSQRRWMLCVTTSGRNCRSTSRS